MFLRVILSLAFVLSISSPIRAGGDDPRVERQRKNTLTKSTPSIYKLTTKPGVVYQVQTALGYITTIDLPEEARKVFVGDTELFKVGVYGSQVIIKPATNYPTAQTNVTIYTASGRLSFDVTVGPPSSADFVLDFRFPRKEAQVQNEFNAQVQEAKQQLQDEYQKRTEEQDQQVKERTQEMFEEALKKGAKSMNLKLSKKQDGIQLTLLSLSELGTKSYLRFGILNYSDRDYEIARIVLGKETVRRAGFNLHKEGFVPVEFTQNVEKMIPKDSYRYGLLAFEKVTLKKNERLTFRLYEKGNPEAWEVSNVPTQAK